MIPVERQEELVRLAMREVDKAVAKGDLPFGALLVDRDGKVLLKSHNSQNSKHDITAHAEMNMLRKVLRKFGRSRFEGEGFGLVSNAESCAMCASALIKIGLEFFIYGASMEAASNPDIGLREIASKARQKVLLFPGVLKDETAEQIRQGRLRLERGKMF